ncbi:hypothetical protein ABZW30_08030 [Kitasatospora sp. NPDC004669]|uniref:hypothetical protein n=1 Tax=Kitasatospora sp. NPDC004669 TaxID=3154555 RepID=UPI0033A86598
MTHTPRRPANELPFGGEDITLHYNLQHPAVPLGYDDTIEEWTVDVDAYIVDPTCHAPGTCENCDTAKTIGTLSFARVRNYTRDSAWQAGDAYSAGVEKAVSACIDPATTAAPGLNWSRAFENHLEGAVGDLLIMERVQLLPQYRGFGLGALAAAEAIRRLSPGCCAVLCEPAPLGRALDHDQAARQKAKARLAALWESVGFRPYQDGIHLLDTGQRHYEQCRETWRRHFATFPARTGRTAAKITVG